MVHEVRAASHASPWCGAPLLCCLAGHRDRVGWPTALLPGRAPRMRSPAPRRPPARRPPQRARPAGRAVEPRAACPPCQALPAQPHRSLASARWPDVRWGPSGATIERVRQPVARSQLRPLLPAQVACSRHAQGHGRLCMVHDTYLLACRAKKQSSSAVDVLVSQHNNTLVFETAIPSS